MTGQFHLKHRFFSGLITAIGCLHLSIAQINAREPDRVSTSGSAVAFAELKTELAEQQREIERLRSVVQSILDDPQRLNTLPPAPLIQDETGTAYLSVQPGQSEAGRAQLSTDGPDTVLYSDGSISNGSEHFSQNKFEGENETIKVGIDFNTQKSLFTEGIVVVSGGVAMKVGGYVKVDFIQDFNPIADEFSFNTSSIEVGAPPRRNATIHARQSRLNLDTRWDSDFGPVRSFVEADLFGNANSSATQYSFRLRHAYGEVRNLIVGQTWSTFANVRALPNTLDNEGSASVVNRRQGLIRWTQPILRDDLSIRLALEDPRSIIAQPSMTPQLTPVNKSPDFHLSLRLEDEQRSYQISTVFRELAVQTPMQTVSGAAWGVNISGALHLGDRDEIYSQLMFGDGIGSYRSLPDITTDGVANGAILSSFSWMVGYTHEWSDKLQSNVVYSRSDIENPFFSQPTDLDSTTYFAVNLIWKPIERYFMGIEYLYGTRTNFDGQDAEAHRLQSSFGFYLP